MEINNQMQLSIRSIRSAIGIETLKRSLYQDAQSMNALLQGFEETNKKAMEISVTPHKGRYIDIGI